MRKTHNKMTNPTQPTGSAPAALSVAEGLTDAELSRLVMIHVAKWHPSHKPRPYATCLDEVTPLMDKFLTYSIWTRCTLSPRVKVRITKDTGNNDGLPFNENYYGAADISARACCYALLRAHGAIFDAQLATTPATPRGTETEDRANG
jgi:hypothetical protein